MTAGKRIRYYGKKLLVFLFSVLALSLLVFYLARLAPGDPLVAYYGERTEKMSVEERERSLERLGLNDPIYGSLTSISSRCCKCWRGVLATPCCWAALASC